MYLISRFIITYILLYFTLITGFFKINKEVIKFYVIIFFKKLKISVNYNKL